MPNLFDAFVLRGVTFNNRVWVSPMCQYSAEDGFPSEWHRVHLGALTTGLPGLLMVEATGVNPEGRISIGCPSLEDMDHANAFKPIIDFAHSFDVKVGIQLSHAGRKGSTMRPSDDHKIADPSEGGWETVSASPIPFPGYPDPRELTKEEIASITEDFVTASKNAVAAGFDVIELHAAHGYLLHQFYSPLSNTRSDEYGGSFEGRIKFLLEVTTAVRSAIPDTTPLFVRITATDWVEDGWNLEDSIELCVRLKELGVDLVDVSTGGNTDGTPIPVEPGYQVPHTSAIRNKVNVATSAVGLITDPNQAQNIVESGDADAVFMARELLRNPRWPLLAARTLGVQRDWPIQLRRA
jgi:2,4-dienoyl-CoA reductase-like NADH-dependent reductase (Old Yellow Enzyme family)